MSSIILSDFYILSTENQFFQDQASVLEGELVVKYTFEIL